MSEEKVDVVGRGIDAMNRLDAEAIVDMCDPEVEWRTELIGTPVYRGHEGVRQALRDVATAWESFHTEAFEVVERDDYLLLGTHATARSRTTGIAVDADFFYVALFRNGKILRFEGFTDRAMALEAAGLTE